eukprot:CAMPEP_0117575294 /NCGR_PEP_ID=MMETSP0784-20121206/62121_1 /TAXON_ID=39447 /ORGANISM="" /LENGTH=241 /DNA_ID=CAMNT_0005374337 /DNA_START=171 /DNA_END=893 /DNA_ORIENTATION=-
MSIAAIVRLWGRSPCRLERSVALCRGVARDDVSTEADSPVRKRLLSACLACGALALLLSFLTLEVGSGANEIQPWDTAVHEWVVDVFSDDQRRNVNAFSNSLDTGSQALAWIVAAWVCLSKRNAIALSMPVGLEVVKAVSGVLKPGVHRPRPSDIVGDFSFPSSHTSRFVFCVSLLLCVLAPLLTSSDGDQRSSSRAARFGTFALAWLAMGTCRVLADAHWASDTIGGAALGAYVATAAEV